MDKGNLLAALQASPDGILLLDADARVQFASWRVAALLRAAEPDLLIGRDVREFVPPPDHRAMLDHLASARQGTEPNLREFRMRALDGTIRWTEWNAELFVEPSGDPAGVLVSVRDAERRKQSERALVAAQKIAEAEIRRLRSTVSELQVAVSTDKLTGVGNRRHLERIASAVVSERDLRGTPVSLLIIDVDHFKRINDTFGHPAGDQVLVGLARILLDSVRVCDTVCRWGGEEFIAVVPGSTGEQTLRLAERLREAVARTSFADVGRITISVGVAELGAHENAEDWIRRADVALYRAKRAGRNRSEMAQPASRSASGGSRILAWRSDFECGDPTIDRQHRELLDFANLILDDVSEGRNPAQAYPRFVSLLGAVRRHFSDEEAWFAKIGAPDLEEHRKMHSSLLVEAARLVEDVQRERLRIPSALDFLVCDLLHDHIAYTDRESIRKAAELASVGKRTHSGIALKPGAQRVEKGSRSAFRR